MRWTDVLRRLTDAVSLGAGRHYGDDPELYEVRRRNDDSEARVRVLEMQRLNIQRDDRSVDAADG